MKNKCKLNSMSHYYSKKKKQMLGKIKMRMNPSKHFTYQREVFFIWLEHHTYLKVTIFINGCFIIIKLYHRKPTFLKDLSIHDWIGLTNISSFPSHLTLSSNSSPGRFRGISIIKVFFSKHG